MYHRVVHFEHQGRIDLIIQYKSLNLPYLTAFVPDAPVAAIPHNDASAPGSEDINILFNLMAAPELVHYL